MRPNSIEIRTAYNLRPLGGGLRFPAGPKQLTKAGLIGKAAAAAAGARGFVLGSERAQGVLREVRATADQLDDLTQCDVQRCLRKNHGADPFAGEWQRTQDLITCDAQNFQVKVYRPAKATRKDKVVIFVGGLAMETGPWVRVGEAGSRVSLMRRALNCGATVIEVDHPGGGLSAKVKYDAKGYAETMSEQILPAVNTFIDNDPALKGQQRTYIGHSLGGSVLKMMVERQGEDIRRAVDGRLVNLVTLASSDRFYPDMDPAFVGMLGLDPLLQSTLGDRRNVPYAALGPLMRVSPEQILRLAAGLPVMGTSLDASLMREYFGTTPLPISSGMIRNVLIEGLLGETKPKVKRGPVVDGFRIISLYAENDPWGPPEGFAELHQDLSPELRARSAFYSVGRQELGIKLFIFNREIERKHISSLGIMAKSDLGLGHAAIALPTPQQSALVGPIIDAVLA